MRALTLLALLAAVPVEAQDSDARLEFERLAARAIQLHEAGDILGAIDSYTAALRIDAGHPGLRSNLGAAYVRLGRYDEAVEQYREALRIDPANATVRFNLGLAYYKAERLNEAIGEFEAVAGAQPAAMLLLGDALLRTGAFGRAIDVLTPKEEEFAGDLAFGYVLGTALLRAGQRDRAQAYLDRIFRSGPSAEGHLLMGTALMETKDWPAAIAELRKAIELNPNLPTLRTVYGRALLGSGDHEGAFREFQRALRANPNDFEAYLHYGALLRRDERHEEAAAYLQRALDLRPHDAVARFGLAGTKLSLGHVDDARALLERVVADVPDYTEAHVMLATCYYRLKRKEDGDRHRAIAERLRQEEQARQPRPGTGQG